MRLAVQTSPRNPYASALRANNAGIWARCSAVNLAGPPGRGWVRSASTPFSRARLSHWHTAAQLTPSAAAMSFCHQPCWDNSQARWRRHSQESARRLDVLMPPAARKIHALTPTSVDPSSMYRLACGRSELKSYKGWTHISSVRQRDHVKTYLGYIAPSGNPVEPITNLAAFCREHGLDKTHMLAVAHSRLCSHRGLTYNNGRQKHQKVHSGIVSPDGAQTGITDLAKVCRTHGLNPVHMHQVKNGQRRSHKGWTWKANDQ